MKLSQTLLSCLALLAITTVAFAAVSATNSPTTTPQPANSKTFPLVGTHVSTGDKTILLPAGALTASAPARLTLDDYIKDLTTTLQLSDMEKQEIQGYYVADGGPLKAILNDKSLSPLQQARKVSDLRDARDAKIEAVLDDWRRQHEFLKIEARYRVALTELVADGGWVAPPPPAPAPAPPARAPGKLAPATNAPPAPK